MKLVIAAALVVSAAPTALMAQSSRGEIYTVGELQVTAQDRAGEALGGSVVSGEVLQNFDKQRVDQALALISGTSASNTGGSRNEQVVYIRGFDRFQTSISIDGVRVFLPADNRIDFARFLTADLSEIQVSKGYVSVLDGPGALGGAINLVTIKPTRALEGDVGYASFHDQELRQDAFQASARIGGKSARFYWQASGVLNDRDHFTLPDSFIPRPFEDGGAREHSNARDWRVNAKLGFQPNDTDEYSLNYTKSEGEKSAPDHVSNPANARYWEWPVWNMDSLSLLTRTRLTDRLTLRSRLYSNGFDNLLVGYDDIGRSAQTLPRSFYSYYADKAYGGNLQVDYDLGDTSRLKGVFYIRRDIHDERQDGFVRPTPPTYTVPFSEPVQRNDELTYSAAGQYSAGLGDKVDLTLGVSYDWTDLRQADDVNVAVAGASAAAAVVTYTPVRYDLVNRHALNGQAALAWRIDADTRLHLSVSDRTRFPTLFERYSSRFGLAAPNPGLRPERAINYEIGGDKQIGRLKLSAAAYYSDLQDALVSVAVVLPAPIGATTQTRNLGKGEYYGFEISGDVQVTDALAVGGNYTLLQRELVDTTNPAFRPIGTPNSKLFAYASWRLLPKLTFRPSLEHASTRYLSTPDTNPTYYKGGAYWLLNAALEYAVTDGIKATLAAENLFDAEYQLQDGFPEAGRSVYASLRARF